MMRYLLFIIAANFLVHLNSECFAQKVLPIKPTRTISFTTNEGSHMDVDISPDGKSILFDLLGDLYLVPANGGTAKQLTRGLALHLKPTWSPDGKKFAYLGDETGEFRLHIMDTSKTFNYVLDRGPRDAGLEYYKSNIIWTKDGNFIVYDNMIYGLTGGCIKSPIGDLNSQQLGFDSTGGYFIKNENLFKCDINNKTQSIIFNLSKKKLWRYSATLSPDTHWFVYPIDSNNHRCLIAHDLINGESKVLSSSLLLNDPNANKSAPCPHFSFSSDSRTIYVGYGGKIHRIDVQSGRDETISFTANIHSDLGPLNYNTYRVTTDSFNVKIFCH